MMNQEMLYLNNMHTVVLNTHKVCEHTDIIQAAGVWLLIVQTAHAHTYFMCTYVRTVRTSQNVFEQQF